MAIVFVLALASSAFVFGPGLITTFLAKHKGYRPWFWLFSLGPVGTLVMLLKPNLSEARTPEEREAWETRADWTGGVMSGFTFLTMFAMPALLIVWFLASVARPVMRAAPAPPPAPVVTSAPVMTPAPVVDTPAANPEGAPAEAPIDSAQEVKPE